MWGLITILSTVAVNGAVNMKFSGQIDTELRYTPENQWEGWDQIWLKSSIETGSNAKAYISFGENNTLRGQRSYWWDNEGRRFGFYVDKAYLTYTGALYSGAPSSVVTIGDLSLNYHPHLLKLDYWDENEYREREHDNSKRGVSINNLQFGRLNSQGFYLWDGGGDSERYSYGYTLEWPWQKGNAKFYSIDFKDMNQGIMGDPKLIQKLKALETNQAFNEKVTVGGLLAVLDQEQDGAKTNTYLWDLKGEYQLSDVLTTTLRYIDFPVTFNPVYRDRTPRYDQYTNRRLAWNELDRYSDQRGVIFGLAHQKGNDFLEVELANLTDHNIEYPVQRQQLSFNGKINLPEKIGFEFWQRFIDVDFNRADDLVNQQTYYSSKYQVSKPLFNSKATGMYVFSYRNSSKQESSHECSIGQEVENGLLTGFTYKVGTKYTKPEPGRFYPFFELEGIMPVGLKLTIRYAAYNQIEEIDYVYDEDGLLIPIDNIISVGAKITF